VTADGSRAGIAYFGDDSIVVNRSYAWRSAQDTKVCVFIFMFNVPFTTVCSQQTDFVEKKWNFKTEQAMIRSIDRLGSRTKNALLFLLLHVSTKLTEAIATCRVS